MVSIILISLIKDFFIFYSEYSEEVHWKQKKEIYTKASSTDWDIATRTKIFANWMGLATIWKSRLGDRQTLPTIEWWGQIMPMVKILAWKVYNIIFFLRINWITTITGLYEIPKSITGSNLPNVRHLSTRLFTRGNVKDPDLTLAIVSWGQLLAHDFAQMVTSSNRKLARKSFSYVQHIDYATFFLHFYTPDHHPINCCTPDGREVLPKQDRHPSCLPIFISSKDKFYAKHGQRCMNFVRAITVDKQNCPFSSADQVSILKTKLVKKFFGKKKYCYVSVKYSNKFLGLVSGIWKRWRIKRKVEIVQRWQNEDWNAQ